MFCAVLSNIDIAGQEIQEVEHYDLVTTLLTSFPWAEYLVRVGWTDNGRHVWAQLLDRAQQRLELVLIPESQFVRSSLPTLASQERNGADRTEAAAPIQVNANYKH